MNTLYIAWQDPDTRQWHTVGRLTQSSETGYRFCYTAGAEASPRFDYLGRMHDLYRCYHSDTLFPLFANRILNRSRPEFPCYLDWLGVDADATPMELLARSGGRRATDSLCVYPEVEPDDAGWMRLYFFSHGLRYLPPDALEALDQLQPGTALQLVPEEHQHDRFALRLEDGAAQPLGYCPRYLNQSLRAVLRETPIQLRVARNNHQAPIQFRLLCEARFPGKAGKQFYGSDEHRPLALLAAA
ncbi:hypothetical protein G3480_05450 [Thiorhodococcus mannitoliphagus]|uniref:HIRAN domain-containing protein n=1 Tax=Thiorhodococcus mannitoliphagus TaxID=329406 RepID=A0A6P1DVQ3_9GAMM|nr:HIRAN domain-containing protein [Thiorhodococcus mannitoliphagus]NEX19764.1 hypothetical protein [Thiorhodococcus mannitoliphagus]